MSSLTPQFEFVDRADESIRYLEHGWPTELCRWHSHEEYELHLIVETQGKVFVGDYIGEFGPGTLFLTGPNLPHNWVTDNFGLLNKVACRDMLVQFNQDSIDHLQNAFPEFRELDNLLQRANGGLEFIKFDINLAKMHFSAIRDAKGADRILKFLNFLLCVDRHPTQNRLSIANVTYPNFKTKKSNIAKVIDHIVQNFSDDINLDNAAEMSNMSSTAFARNFQKMTGSRFTEFVIRVRIGQACLMLRAADQNIAFICHEVGFRNLANFNRQFLRIKNTTPSSYREISRSEFVTSRGLKNE